MSEKVIFLRSQLPKTDARLQRYISILEQEKIEHLVIGWIRNGIQVDLDKKQILYRSKTPIGGGIKNIFSLILWNFFLIGTLWKNRKNYTTIHSVDFDTAIPAYVISFILKKKFILDIYDKYTDARKMPLFISKIIDVIEYFCCKRASVLILPDICRIKQLNLEDNIKPIIFENVPIVSNFQKHNITFDKTIILSYVGILEAKNRGLENLLDVVSENATGTKLLIAGDGELKEFVEKMAEKYDNILFYGGVSQQRALEIMNSSHIIVGMYYKTIKNHLFASPNKYYEHLFLGKALLTTEGTPPGDKVLKYNTGYAIGETKEDIERIIDDFDFSQWQSFTENAKKRWNDQYSNYQEELSKRYINLIEHK